MNVRRHVILSITALFALAGCGGGQDPNSASSSASVQAQAATSPQSSGNRITQSMVRTVAAPPKPDNGVVEMRPGLHERENRNDHAGNYQRNPNRVVGNGN